jgi:hypothetical protein
MAVTELLRDEALALCRLATEYLVEAERRGLPRDFSEDLRERIMDVLSEAYR